MKKIKTYKKQLLIALLIGLLALTAYLVNWFSFVRQPLPEALEALKSDAQITVTNSPWLSFTPVITKPQTALIIYPGGRIDPRGFAPSARAIAEEGYLVIIPEMTLNIAIFNPNLAEEIIKTYPEIKKWVIGGHSVGGVAASKFVHDHPDLIDGLVIWASYPTEGDNLSSYAGSVATIYGTLDPAANATHIETRRHLLPPQTHYVPIEGGDHHQFGSYELEVENLATISRTEQQKQILAATLAVLDEVNK